MICHKQNVLIYSLKDIITIKFILQFNEQLNIDFNSLCDWFVDNKLSIHFGEDKTKSKLDIQHWDIKITLQSNIKQADIKSPVFEINCST